jgi:hypothetical protein
MEMGKIPFFGQALEEEMKKDPTLQGSTKFIFFVAREVTLAPAGTAGAASGESADEAADRDSGWE